MFLTVLAGLIWQNRVNEVRKVLRKRRVDGLVLTALDEVAWLLNIRGRDLPHAPLLTSYLLLNQHRTTLYMDRQQVTPILEQHLKSHNCVTKFCVRYAHRRTAAPRVPVAALTQKN